jgi:leucine-rich repeat protein SHOC2
MAPFKRRKISTSSQMGHVQRTLRTVSVQCDLSALDADLDAEPEELICPIMLNMFRDPVMVVDSGHTYERSAILMHFERNGAKDPLTGLALSSTKVMTNWAVRQIVQAWLDKHPDVTPYGWKRRELLEPSKGDAGVLRTWRAMCPELQERWPEDEPTEQWSGVTMDNGRVVKLDLEEFGLTGALPAEIGQLTSLRKLGLSGNKLLSLPAEIWQLTSLRKLYLTRNQLTSVPAEIGQLTSLQVLWLSRNKLTSVPAEIGQLTSLRELRLYDNKLTSLPAEIGLLTTLKTLYLGYNQLTSLPAEIGQLTALKSLFLNYNQLTSLSAEIGQLTSLEGLYLQANHLTSLPAEIGQLTALTRLNLYHNQLTSVPAEVGQLTSLEFLGIYHNHVINLPAELGQLTSLKLLSLNANQLTSVPAAVDELRAAVCNVSTDVGVTWTSRNGSTRR